MWRDMLNGMLNDVLYGIATAVTTLPKGALTAEAIMAEGIRYTVQRFVASDPPEEPVSPIDASRYFVEKHLGGVSGDRAGLPEGLGDPHSGGRGFYGHVAAERLQFPGALPCPSGGVHRMRLPPAPVPRGAHLRDGARHVRVATRAV
jgi:hypothetical protein